MEQPSSNDVKTQPPGPDEGQDNSEATWEEIRPWAEFCCWTTLVMAPIINWLNGPAVSNGQAVVRTGLIVLAAFGGIALRLYAWLKRPAA
jgi:hypothetical protein